MINKVILAGRIANEPKLKKISDQFTVTTFNIAVDRGYRKDSEKQNVDFLYCKAFNKTALNIHSYCKVGSGVCITGQIHNNKFEKDGKVQYITEIVVENIKFLPNFGVVQTSDILPKTPDEIWQELSDNEKAHVIMLKKEAYLREYVKRQGFDEDTQKTEDDKAANEVKMKWQDALNDDRTSINKIEVTTDEKNDQIETENQKENESTDVTEDIKNEAAEIVEHLKHKQNANKDIEITTDLPF